MEGSRPREKESKKEDLTCPFGYGECYGETCNQCGKYDD